MSVSDTSPPIDPQAIWKVTVRAADGWSRVDRDRVVKAVDDVLGDEADLVSSREAVFVYADDEDTAQRAHSVAKDAALALHLLLEIQVTRWSDVRQRWVAPGDPEPDLPAGYDPAASGEAHVMVSTTFGIPGYEIVAFHGEVFGLVVRSRNALATWGASAKALVGGELRSLTRLLAEGRNDAIERMRRVALSRGANAVVGLRYDTSQILDSASEVVAYGTAVTVQRVAPSGARPVDPPNDPDSASS